MNFLKKLWSRPAPRPCTNPWRHSHKANLAIENLESRNLMSASPLPVLMVIADQDFYYKELNDTRAAIVREGLDVVVAASTTNPATPHANSGQIEAGVSGIETPDIALADADADDYSAIVFVGGWGSSMYQYAYNDPNLDGVVDNFYWNAGYNADANLTDGVPAPQKAVANDLINEFVAQDKYVAAICHGVTVLAWARVDGVSPLAGKQVSAPLTVGSPGQFYNGVEQSYPYFNGQHDQVVDNGGIPNHISGMRGNPNTAADDVVVDGKIITAENYDSAYAFGTIIAGEVKAAAVEQGPVVQVGDEVVIRGTDAADTIYIWSSAQASSASVWINGAGYGPFTGVAHVRVFGGDGNDHVFATDLRIPATISGEGGHDLIVGGSAGNVIDGGAGVDRIMGGIGNDLLLGGDGDDHLGGREGNDVLLGGSGNDVLLGGAGLDVLIGSTGGDRLEGGAGDDLLVGGITSFDGDPALLAQLGAAWIGTANGGVWKTTSADGGDDPVDIIVGTGVGGHIKVFSGSSGQLPTAVYEPTGATYLCNPLDGDVLYAIDVADGILV